MRATPPRHARRLSSRLAASARQARGTAQQSRKEAKSYAPAPAHHLGRRPPHDAAKPPCCPPRPPAGPLPAARLLAHAAPHSNGAAHLRLHRRCAPSVARRPPPSAILSPLLIANSKSASRSRTAPPARHPHFGQAARSLLDARFPPHAHRARTILHPSPKSPARCFPPTRLPCRPSLEAGSRLPRLLLAASPAADRQAPTARLRMRAHGCAAADT